MMYDYFSNLFKCSEDKLNMYQQYLNDNDYTETEKHILTKLILQYNNDYEVILNNDKIDIDLDRIVCSRQIT